MSQVLGISVTDLEIASVVADAGTGAVLARNFVELQNTAPDAVFDAIYQLVQSAPIMPESIAIACADSATTVAIGDIIDSGRLPAHLLPPPSFTGAAESNTEPTKPDWFARTTVVGSPVAYAEIAAVISGARGLVLVADLDRSGALFPGQSVALVDTDTRVVVGASEISGIGARPPVTEPDGAQLVGDAVGVIANASGALQGIVVLGPGARIPGVAPSLEYALQLPVQVADDGQYATAYGAAMVAAAVPRRSDNSRWVLLSAAAAAALFVAIGVITAVVMTSSSSEPNTAVDERPTSAESTTTSTSKTTTTTTTTKKTTKKKPTSKTTTSSPTPVETTTQAPPVIEEPTTVTVVPPPTTITQTPPSPSPSPPPPSETPPPPSETSPPISESPPSPGVPGEGENPIPQLPPLPELPRLLPQLIPQ